MRIARTLDLLPALARWYLHEHALLDPRRRQRHDRAPQHEAAHQRDVADAECVLPGAILVVRLFDDCVEAVGQLQREREALRAD